MMSTNKPAWRKGGRRTLLLLASSLFGLGGAPALAQQTPTTPSASEPNSGVGEIIVTATKREENLQDVPLAVQAIGQQQLEQLNITSFTEYAQYLPSLSYSASYGPGYNRPFIRGVASGENGNHSGPQPSVGTYLDEQPITTITGNLDLHLYDIARVEVLEGPQGTLYGASSQSGTVRIITNKPDPSSFSGGVDGEANTILDHGHGQTVEGFLNVPITENAAVRLVAWAEHDGGYIDNRHGTRLYPTSGVVADNANVAQNDYNTVDTVGARAALGIHLGDNWTVTPQIMGQRQDSNGVFADEPNIGHYAVTHWFNEFNHDKWLQGALTINGEVSNFDVVFAGAYLARDVEANQDYADYGYFYDTYLGYGSYFTDNNFNPINPAQQVRGLDRYHSSTYELRISSPAQDRLRFIGGLFYQHSLHRIHQQYIINGLNDAHEIAGHSDTIWLTEQLRTDQETAAFGEAAFDFTQNLTGTVGARIYRTENSLEGFFGFSAGFAPFYGLGPDYPGEQTCTGPSPLAGAPCEDLNKSTEESGTLYRVNLQYRFDPDRMVYATFSQGFRPGGINRRGTLPPYAADFLDNYEAGWKTEWFDHHLRWNGALYLEKWRDFQFSFLGANGLTEIQNAGNAQIVGIESDLTWVPFEGLTIRGAGTVLHSEMTNTTAFADKGTRLPTSPEVKADIVARYEFPLGDLNAFAQLGVIYQGDSTLDLRPAEAALIGTLPAYWLTNVSFGVDQGDYRFSLYVDNLFNERAITGRYTECAIGTCFGQPYDVVGRPMTFGVRLGHSF